MEIDGQGSSRSRGGILRGRAVGNVFNLADAHQDIDVEMLPILGYVFYYVSDANPSTLMDIQSMNPSGSFAHNQVNTVAPILRQLVRRYPQAAGIC